MIGNCTPTLFEVAFTRNRDYGYRDYGSEFEIEAAEWRERCAALRAMAVPAVGRAPKPVSARIAGLDIRRLIPRRLI